MSAMAFAAHAQKTIQVPGDQPTIQAGLDAASNGDTVLVAPGTYFENVNFNGKAVTLTSSAGAAKTAIDGRLITSVVTMGTVVGVAAPTLNGFTIQHGLSPNGAVNVLGNAVITHDVINGNKSCGIDAYGGNLTIQGNTISFNVGSQQYNDCYFGLGINLALSLPSDNVLIDSNVIQGNGADGIQLYATSGMLLRSTVSPVLSNNIVSGNSQDGMFFSIVSATITQNLIYGNQLSGVQSIGQSLLFLSNNTVSGNGLGLAITQTGSEVAVSLGDGLYAVNNLLVGTSARSALSCAGGVGYGDSFDHNDIVNLAPVVTPPTPCNFGLGTFGNIAVDPHFVSPSTGNFHLTAASPAVDTGINAVSPVFATDLDGKPRIQDATNRGCPVIDMGAYELAGVVETLPPTIAVTSSATSVTLGAPFSLTATVTAASGIPTGQATFFADGVSLGSAPLDLTGNAVLNVPSLLPGLHGITASYAGASGVCPAVSVHIYVTVSGFITSLTLAASANPALLNQPVTLGATISSPDNTIPSPVTLTDNGTVLQTSVPNSFGYLPVTTSALSLGTHTITASYAGDSMHTAASATLVEQIVSALPTTVGLVSSLNPAQAGQRVTFTASVITAIQVGVATGSVVFSDSGSGATLAVVALPFNVGTTGASYNAQVSFSTSALSAGTHTIVATYLPTNGYQGGSASVAEIITAGLPTTLTVTCTPNPAFVGQTIAVNLQIAASGAVPTGSVTISSPNAMSVSGAFVNGLAALQFLPLPAGTHVLTATYVPDLTFAPATATCNETVDTLPTMAALFLSASTPLPIVPGSPISLVVDLSTGSSITPTGSIALYAGTVPIGTATANSSRLTSISLNPVLPVGLNELTCVYAGDATYSGSTCAPLAVTVAPNPITTTLAASSSRIASYQPVVLSAHVAAAQGTSAPITGPISFTANGVGVGQAMLDANGNAVVTVATLTTGNYALAASYAGSGAYPASSSGSLTLTVIPAGVALAFSAAPNPAYQGQTVTLQVAATSPGIAEVPAGQVQIAEQFPPSTVAQLLATLPLPASGSVSFATAGLPVGLDSLVATYLPANTTFANALAPLSVTVLAQDFSVVPSANEITVRTQYHTSVGLTVASIGNFAETVSLGCSNLPPIASCTFRPGSVGGSPAQSGAASVTIDTDAVLGFKSLNVEPFPRPGLIAFAVGLPALFLLRRRRRLRLLAVLLAAVAMVGLSSCSGHYPASTPPGTYTIYVNAASSSRSHATTITLVVTE